MVRVLFVLLLALPAFAASEVVPGIHLIRGRFTPGTQPDGNTIILTAPDGLIVVDTGRHPAHTQAIVDFAKAAKKPVKAIVNTHWHLDHIGGNAMLRREFPEARVYASGALAGARTGFLANYRKQLEKEPENAAFRAEIALMDALVAPDEVITASGSRSLAGRALDLSLEIDAVTAGDVWLLDRSTGVLIAGDLVTLPAPFLDTANAARWQAVLDRLAKADFELLIPGHGPPLTRRQFAAYRLAFANLLACKEGCVERWIADVATLVPAEETEFMRVLMGYYVDLLKRR